MQRLGCGNGGRHSRGGACVVVTDWVAPLGSFRAKGCSSHCAVYLAEMNTLSSGQKYVWNAAVEAKAAASSPHHCTGQRIGGISYYFHCLFTVHPLLHMILLTHPIGLSPTPPSAENEEVRNRYSIKEDQRHCGQNRDARVQIMRGERAECDGRSSGGGGGADARQVAVPSSQPRTFQQHPHRCQHCNDFPLRRVVPSLVCCPPNCVATLAVQFSGATAQRKSQDATREPEEKREREKVEVAALLFRNRFSWRTAIAFMQSSTASIISLRENPMLPALMPTS